MDFGRKGDNKRAMDLMWKSGMSLKQAWKVVKGKSKSKSRPTRRNCFGARDGMCPQGYEINPGTGRMRKICEFGRDPVTGKCLKGPRAFKAAPDGYEYNLTTGKYRKICEYGRDMKTGRCLPMPRVAGIKEGYEINPETGRLRKVCVYGRNVNGRCFGRPMDQTIPPRMGYEYAPNGKLRKICLYGRDPVSGRCVGKPRLGPVGIPEGYEVNPGTGRYRKMCLPGYYRTPGGRCVPMKQALQYEDAMEYPVISGNPFDTDYLDTNVLPASYNPFDDDPISTSSSTSACPPSNPFCPQRDDDDDYDPFSVFTQFGKKRPKARPRTRRSCFGSCSSCDMY